VARYYRQTLTQAEAIPRAPAGPLLGQQIARRPPVVAALRAQDRVVAQSRRIVLESGISGAARWLVPNTNPVSAVRTYPLRDAQRIVARTQFRLTPGCMLELRALAGLSGQTQRAATSGELGAGALAWQPGGVQGEIRLTATWDDGGTPVQRVSTVVLPGSGELYGRAPTDAAGQFAALRVRAIDLITPQALSSSVIERRWCQPTVVTLSLAYVGGARVVSCVVSEVPHVATMEADDPTWASHVLGSTPSGPAPAVAYPYQRLSEVSPDGDPRGGAWHLQDVANTQALLGPTLLRWHAYDEDDELVTIAEAAPRISTSTSFASLDNASLAAWSLTNEGWSLAAGAYARRRKLNDPDGMPHNGVVPVRLRAYCRGSDGAVSSGGVLRLQTGPYQWVDLTIASGAAAGWYSAIGHARVGRGPGDPEVVQLLFRRTGGAGGFSIWSACVEVGDQADP